LARLQKRLDAHERIFTTVPGLAEFVLALNTTNEQTCAVRMCFLRGDHFTTDRSNGTHLEFVDAESAQSFVKVRKMILSVPTNITNGETRRLTMWEPIDLSLFVPAWVTQICAADRVVCTAPYTTDSTTDDHGDAMTTETRGTNKLKRKLSATPQDNATMASPPTKRHHTSEQTPLETPKTQLNNK
ncbi:hypothetical protein GN958_ATG11185, partial [Phytophthora infestans]